MSLSQMEIITTTDGDGQNCQDRALAAMHLYPQLRAVIGSLLLQGCRDLRTGRRVDWAKPWGHHIWLIEPDGDCYDPSACNLAHWARVQEMELPRPWQQLTAGVIDSQREQARIVGQITGGHPTASSLPDAVYLPGLIYSTNTEEMPAGPAYVTAWGRLAIESVKAGGWDAAQLNDAMGRVDGLMAGPPRIRSTKVPMNHGRRPRRSGRGFALGLARQLPALAGEVG